MTELRPDEPLDEGYWESLGASDDYNQDRAPGSDINPFEDDGEPAPRGSRYVAQWFETYGGIEFIDVFSGEQPGSTDSHTLVFLLEVLPGRFNVGVCPSKSMRGSRFLVEDTDYETGKAKAERAAGAMSVDAGVNAGWRQSPPSSGQLGLIARLGLEVDHEITSKGQASDLLNVHFDSHTLDTAFRSDR